MYSKKKFAISSLIFISVILIGILLFNSAKKFLPFHTSYSSSTKITPPITNLAENSAPNTKEAAPMKPTLLPSQNVSSQSVLITTHESIGGLIIVDAKVEGASQGECVATFSKNGFENIVRIEPIIPITSYFSCKSFELSKSVFPATGAWNLTVRLMPIPSKDVSDQAIVLVQ